jgi:hypothetical protein
MISVMRETWLEAWLTRYGLRVWMARSNDWKGMILQYYECNDINLVLCISMDRV